MKEVCLEYTPEAQCGDYVLVHVGFALGKVDEAEAKRTYEALQALDQLGELEGADVRTEANPAIGIDPVKRNLPSESRFSASGGSP